MLHSRTTTIPFKDIRLFYFNFIKDLTLQQPQSLTSLLRSNISVGGKSRGNSKIVISESPPEVTPPIVSSGHSYPVVVYF